MVHLVEKQKTSQKLLMSENYNHHAESGHNDGEASLK